MVAFDLSLRALLALTILLVGSSCSPVVDHVSLADHSLLQTGSDWRPSYEYPLGDPRRCQQLATKSKMDVMWFEALPGLGWDNLQNKEMGMVVQYNYSRCKVTDDGRYLIPDDVIALPIKSSYVETFAEMIDSYLRTTSTTSNTVNVQAGLSTHKFTGSGSFSWEHQKIKSKQIEDESVTTRVQLRYERYDARLQPDPELDPKFKGRLLSIAGHLLLNETEQAIYEGELLVRDYGTHVLTSVVAGAGLVKTDFLLQKNIGEQDFDKTDILAQASASFLETFHISASYQHSSSSSVSTKYTNSLTHSYITTHGGPLLGENTSLSAWVDGVDLNLVPMDRAGDPLYFLITSKLFPELPAPTLAALEKIVRNSLEMYYEMNTIRGCTKLSSPNFSQSANFDDNTCEAKLSNLTFGGVFQTCSITSGKYLQNNPCSSMTHNNPSTGQASCPSGYTAFELFSGKRTSPTESKTSCSGWWIFKHCHTDQYTATATYKACWCAATGPVSQDSGYLFGGFYSSHSDNPVTGTQGCPEKFYSLDIFTDHHICLSDDYEWTNGVPFGGLFSCQQGNPLALPGGGVKGQLHSPRPNSLRSYFGSNGGGQSNGAAPQKCATGYSQHVALVEQGCAIHYCTRTRSLSSPMLPPVKRPPFSTEPPALIQEKDNVVIFNMRDQTWYKNEDARMAMELINPSGSIVKDSATYQMSALGAGLAAAKRQSADVAMSERQNTKAASVDVGLSTGSVAGIVIGVTVGIVAVLVVIGVLVARRRQEPFHRLTNEETKRKSTYGSDQNDAFPEARVNLDQTSSASV